MAKIAPYTPQPAPLMFETEEGQSLATVNLEFGGWNAAKKQLKPIKVGGIMSKPVGDVIIWVLDSLTAAAEAGQLDDKTYIRQLFASEDDLDVFTETLRSNDGYSQPFNDRYIQALVRITGSDRNDAYSYSTVAAILENGASDINW
jgi:hypothetical protein